MLKRIIQMWYRRKTAKLTKIPLITIVFDYEEYKNGVEKNCHAYYHPEIPVTDTVLNDKLKDCVDYIRENYDMVRFAEVFYDGKQGQTRDNRQN